MGSILNFIKLPNTKYNGEGLVHKKDDNVPLFHLSIFENWLTGTSYQISNEYQKGKKNIFYIECFEGLKNFYIKDDYTKKTILDTLPNSLLKKNKKVSVKSF